jgi:hypothetical protein
MIREGSWKMIAFLDSEWIAASFQQGAVLNPEAFRRYEL